MTEIHSSNVVRETTLRAVLEVDARTFMSPLAHRGEIRRLLAAAACG
jgi:hypothetical protein